MSRRIAFKTVGCRLNQYEAEALATQFRGAGYVIADFGEDADVYVINSCTVTAQSDQKSRQYLRRAARQGKDPVVVIMGCMATHHREALEADGAATYVVENTRKSSVFQLVEAHFRGEVVHPHEMPPDFFAYPVADRLLRTRSMIKIQDGCNNFCSFCIIPKVRGRAVSRPMAEVLDNVREVVDRGAREVVLTGVNIGRYDDGDCNFDDLVEAVLKLPGDFRLRVSSLEPDGFGEKFIDHLTHDKMTPHLHLCLQSGSERVVRHMRRMYTVAGFVRMAHRIRERVPDFNLSTDVLVGFPGETEEDFDATLDVIRELTFSHVHTFKYSLREGTRAARMPEQISDDVKAARSARVRELSEGLRDAYLEGMVGKRQRLLVERVRDGMACGYGEHYVPIEMAGGASLVNRFVDVTLRERVARDGRAVLVADPAL